MRNFGSEDARETSVQLLACTVSGLQLNYPFLPFPLALTLLDGDLHGVSSCSPHSVCGHEN